MGKSSRGLFLALKVFVAAVEGPEDPCHEDLARADLIQDPLDPLGHTSLLGASSKQKTSAILTVHGSR